MRDHPVQAIATLQRCAHAAALFVLVCPMALIARQQSHSPAGTPLIQPTGVPHLLDRLQALRPDAPMDYFELAEEVAYELPDDDGQNLARHLYVLAFELDRRSAAPLGLGRSVCLALADLSPGTDERRWLLAMADSVESGLPADVWSRERPESERDEVAHQVARAIGHYLAEEFRDAEQLLNAAPAKDVLRELGELRPPWERVIERMTEDISARIACPRCRNERIVRATRDSLSRQAPMPGNEQGVLRCPECQGNPGPRLARDAFLELLRIQATLMRADAQSWGGAELLQNGMPLRDVEPDELASWFDVDPGKPCWRPGQTDRHKDGQWFDPEAPADVETPADASTP